MELVNRRCPCELDCASVGAAKRVSNLAGAETTSKRISLVNLQPFLNVALRRRAER